MKHLTLISRKCQVITNNRTLSVLLFNPVLSEKEMEELTGKGNVIDILAEDIIKAKAGRKEK